MDEIAAHGFLPKEDPLTHLSSALSDYDAIAYELPKLLLSDDIRKLIENLPIFDVSLLQNEPELERAMMVFSYLGHAYVWGEKQPALVLPAIIAQPWHAIAIKLGRPPVLSYASYALNNWKRINPHGPIEIGNIALLQNFLGGIDEEWFILIHVDIESKAVPALASILQAQKALVEGNRASVTAHLETIKSALEKMCETLERMPEHCDPYIYYNRVRPYIHGWKDNPALPNGLIYEGVAAYQNKPQFFKGETGAQSTIVPTLDAFLGIEHRETPLRKHLDEMRIYMPPDHRIFLENVENNSKLRPFVIKHAQLVEHYNACIDLLYRFRHTHLNYAASYIEKQTQSSVANPTHIGTGGTPFMAYLREHIEETKQHRI